MVTSPDGRELEVIVPDGAQPGGVVSCICDYVSLVRADNYMSAGVTSHFGEQPADMELHLVDITFLCVGQ